MGYVLKLELSEDIYSLLMRLSEKAGQLPEILAAQWIITEARKLADDPLEKFIGRFRTGKPDWADNHDRYLGETLNENMKAG